MSEQRWIRLTRQEQSRQFVQNRGEGFRLTVTAVEANKMPLEIFLYRKAVIDPTDENTPLGDEFLGVCSCVDLTEYPISAPAAGASPAFFRKKLFDLVLPSQTLALDVWLTVLEEVRVLVESLNKLDYLNEEHVITIGEYPETSYSESEP